MVALLVFLIATTQKVHWAITLSKIWLDIYTLIGAEMTKTIPCPLAYPRIGHIREYPSGIMPMTAEHLGNLGTVALK